MCKTALSGDLQFFYRRLKVAIKQNRPNIVSIAGYSGSGKTTFLEKLIPHLKERGYKLGVIKHAHCRVDMDKKGKDSWRHKSAGAAATLVISPGQLSIVKDYDDITQNAQDLVQSESETIERVKNYLSDMDLIVVEGFKHASLPKCEIFRVAAGHSTPLFFDDKNLIAFITDSDYKDLSIPSFGLDDAKAVADLIEKRYILKF
ncbi:MAG: molybdopterin-guanine dinucleotide biosynthesis protein B [Desulfamplus sp.]|nr:molybdopterin-guanine dinucleotide biosynthesis protein B [Desulfamplus sp.]